MSGRVSRIAINCLLKVFHTLVELFSRSFVPVVAPSEICLVRLYRVCVAFSKSSFLPGAQLQSQLLSYFPCYLFLHCEDIRQIAVVVLAPELRVICDIYQLGTDDQPICYLTNSAREHRLYVELAPNLLRIDFLVLIAKDCAARHHPQFGKLRKSIDDALRNAVAEVIQLRISSDVS